MRQTVMIVTALMIALLAVSGFIVAGSVEQMRQITEKNTLMDEMALQVKQLVEAEDEAKFYEVLKETPYGRQEELQTGRTPDIQLLSNQMLNRIYGKTGHRYPHSPAVLDSYLYRKELEMRKIITALEGIRYGLPAAEIMGLLAKQ